uniref:IMD domain-containing protein n=1 Tax=Strongyloides stercoralis TaxID=6248 RepID=A0A0K0EEI8_STRER
MTPDSLIYFDLFNSVLCDSKATSIAFENACTKAKKLISSLNNTASTLNSFLDAIQKISDHANNLKGASKDIGADLTRFCLRQRSFESHLKSLASSLTEHFIGDLEKKAQISKTKFGDIERKYGRLFKKSKNSHKKGFSDYIKLEQKNGCIDALMYQRNQFIMFVNSIIPAMSIQVDMMEEGHNFKEIRDSLERTLTNCNSHEIVAVTIDDLVNNFEKNINIGKPPLPGRQSMTSSYYGSPPNTQTFGFNSLSISSNDLCDSTSSITRPISLYDGDSTLSIDESNSTTKCSSFFSDTISQIDQLSSVLNEYCEPSATLTRQISPLNTNISVKSSSVRLRDSWKPPPPERRNSSITSATRNAPSIAKVRLTSACQSRASSIQDLITISSNTSGISPNQTPTASEYVQPPSLLLQSHHYQQQPPSTFSFRI